MKFDDKAKWSPVNESIFIHILHEHVKKSDLQTSSFSKKVWFMIYDELYAETLKRYSVPKLKAKYNCLRKKHREFSELINHTGIRWDPISNTVTAANEVWIEYIKVIL